MKRFLCVLLCAVLILSVLPFSALAEEETTTEERQELTEEELEELKTLLIESMNEGEDVDVSKYRLTREELQDIYYPMVNAGYFPWDSETHFDYSLDTEGFVTFFRPKLLRNSRFDEKQYEEKMAELIAETCLEGMEPWQMVLNIHDRIVTRCTYDYYNTNNGYCALVTGKTACYGYSRLFLEVMERLGIPCKIVIAEDTGNGAGHAWNVVELDGDWYHLDLTWDDPTGVPRYGYCRHKHFLKSDSQFDTEINGHNFPWEVDVTCVGGTYSSQPVWKNIENPIVFPDAQTMLMREDTREKVCIYAVDCATMESTLIYEEAIPVVSLSSGAYFCTSYGLSLYEGRVYFTNSKEIVSILPDGTDRQIAFQREDNDGKYLISSHVQDGVLYYNLADGTGNYKEEQASLGIQPSHIHSYSSQNYEATCYESGYKQWDCECGITFQTDRVKTAGHTMTEELVQEGTTQFLRQSCQKCDYVLDGEPTPIPTEGTEESTLPMDAQGDPLDKSKSGNLVTILIAVGVGMIAMGLCFFLILRNKKK